MFVITEKNEVKQWGEWFYDRAQEAFRENNDEEEKTVSKTQKKNEHRDSDRQDNENDSDEDSNEDSYGDESILDSSEEEAVE